MRRTRLTLAATLIASAGLVVLPGTASAAPAPADVPVQFLTVNDLHGRIATPAADNRDGQITLDGQATLVGGAGNIATAVGQARASFTAAGGTADSSALIGMGDLVGASPFESAAFRDESTIEVLNSMGMAVSVVGNHEFDRGTDELRRISGATDGTYTDGIQACADVGLPSDYCFPDSQGQRFAGTDFPYLAANVVVKGTTTPMLPPYEILEVGGGQRVGVIGVVTETTDTIVAPTGIADVDFIDEAEAINRWAAVLQGQGVQSIVALVHEGGTPETPAQVSGCGQLTGPIVDINNRTSAAVDIVLSAHTHQNYSCYLADPAGQPRLVAQAGFYGRELGDIRFVIDGATGDVDRLCGTYTATNVPVLQSLPDDAPTQAIVDYWVAKAATVGNQQVGSTSAPLNRDSARTSESPLANTIAQAQLEALRDDPSGAYEDGTASYGGAPVVAFMNPGGVRANIDQGPVTYNEAFTVQPFGNYVNAVTLTGEQLRLVLEQQFITPARSTQLFMGTSEGFRYSYDLARAPYDRVDPASIQIDDPATPAQDFATVSATATYRVVMNSFLATGGDSFSAFTLGTEPVTGPVDVDTFIDFLDRNPNYVPVSGAAGTPNGVHATKVDNSTWATAPLAPPAGGGSGGDNGGTATATGISGALGVAAAGYTCTAAPGTPDPGTGTPGTPAPGTQPVAHPGNGIAAGQLANTGAATGQLTVLGVGLLLAGGVATAAGYRRGRGVTR
ncbi:5'-nucleotidase [Klenkia marina]|uniref:5'-nucleotidase n=1 Tax=Klenkia marina TaxID=1960309 RepID=A0A1G4YHG1_9ACTN|nr:bifunctional metallophosphatase/5'-nucleotidase [Klenkia marina]SCX52745.1 5'-nucleotidase [Klenkia marina]